jgi:hypothetical protein
VESLRWKLLFLLHRSCAGRVSCSWLHAQAIAAATASAALEALFSPTAEVNVKGWQMDSYSGFWEAVRPALCYLFPLFCDRSFPVVVHRCEGLTTRPGLRRLL